jgi:tRNA (mo5U34)-methyltransferase
MAHSSEIQSQADTLPWFHSIELGDGVVTKGAKAAHILAAEADIVFKHFQPGWSVLDVGAWDGFFSFSAKRRGASRVTATDQFSWVGDGWGTKRSFDFARATLNLEVEDRIIDPLEMNVDTVEPFDVVLFLGVLYHLKHPLYVLERIAALAEKQLIMETQLDMTEYTRPAVAFYPGRELANDPTNWWAPNVPAAIAMLKTAGFANVEHTDHPKYPGVRGFFHAFK